jgi:hypothetical protein
MGHRRPVVIDARLDVEGEGHPAKGFEVALGPLVDRGCGEAARHANAQRQPADEAEWATGKRGGDDHGCKRLARKLFFGVGVHTTKE